MTFEHRTYNTVPSAPIATVASAVRTLVVKIKNTSERRWRALEEGELRLGSPQLLTGYRRYYAQRVEAAPRGFVIIMSERG